MTTALTTTLDTSAIVRLVVDGLDSPHSKRAYSQALDRFMRWYAEQGKPGISKATAQAYRAYLQETGLAPSSINVAMSAVRRLCQEAADNGLVPQEVANGVARVKGVKSAGTRAGNWLTRAQAQALLNTPDVSTTKGIRDRGVLGYPSWRWTA